MEDDGESYKSKELFQYLIDNVPKELIIVAKDFSYWTKLINKEKEKNESILRSSNH